tara:strand:+ start:328 stop:531 length:204 start_codon:yes stop_codon:yes gene_type:complete
MSQKTFVCDDCGLKFNFEDISVNEVSICKLCNDDDDRKQSSFWLSQQPQTDREIQTEHWADDRRIDF